MKRRRRDEYDFSMLELQEIVFIQPACLPAVRVLIRAHKFKSVGGREKLGNALPADDVCM